MKYIIIALSAAAMIGCTSAGFGRFLKATADVMAENERNRPVRQEPKKKHTCWTCHGNGWVESSGYGNVNGVKKCTWCKGTGEIED